MSPEVLKLQQYCAYQERCHAEVRDKGLQLGLRGQELEDAIAHLVSENFLNEERFAIAFAGGKFRMQQWGRRKIKMMLQQKQVSDYCIRKGLSAIDPDDYDRTLTALAAKKSASLRGEHPLKKTQKIIQYLLQKGYETELARAAAEKAL